MTPAVTPIARRNVEKAENDEIRTRVGKYDIETRTIDLILHLLSIAHECSINPIPRKYHPSNDAESVPTEIHQRSLRIPQTFPKVRVLEGVEDVRILDGDPRGWTAVLLGASEVEPICRQWDDNRDECCANGSAKLV